MVEASNGKLPVFISWSQPLSGEVAKILRDWLRRLIQDIEPWHSGMDIEKGSFWNREIITNLQRATVGIIVVTPANMDRPWPNFEAGALTMAIEPLGGIVMPLLINMKGSSFDGPMSSLQVTRFEKEDFYRLVEAINARTRNPLADDILRDEFDDKWPKLHNEVQSVLDSALADDPVDNAAPEARPQEIVLEDLVSVVRDLRRDIKGQRRGGTPFSIQESAVLAPITELLLDAGIAPIDIKIQEVAPDGTIHVLVVMESDYDRAAYRNAYEGIIRQQKFKLSIQPNE